MSAKRGRRVGGQVFVCDLGYHEGVPMVEHPPVTPECEPHTATPRDYIAHSEWADMMAKTHAQRQCKGCGLWAIWEPIVPEDAS